MGQLSETEFRATMGDPMTQVAEKTALPGGFWEYVEAIPKGDYAGYRDPGQQIIHAWRDPTGRWDHVHLSTHDINVLMVVLIRLSTATIHGHHLLNLRTHYGLDDPPGTR